LQQTEFYKGDAGKLPVDDQTLDAVSCTQVLLYVKDVPNVLAEMRRILKPGGRLASFSFVKFCLLQAFATL